MPKVDLTASNKVVRADEFPRLKLAHGERARIVCIEPAPEMLFVHTLRAPVLDDQGNLVKEMRESKRGSYEAPTLSFVGAHICFGDHAVLSDKGVDPKNCPTCQASVDTQHISAPERRYAMNVLQYVTQSGTFKAALPVNIKVVAWAFTATRFNRLIEAAEEWGDLRKHDLMLGPCENANFQKYEFAVASDATWMSHPDVQKMAIEAYQNNKAPDLEAIIGRRISEAQAREDIAQVLSKWDQANGTTTATSAAESSAIDAQLDDLLSGSSTLSAEPSGPSATEAVLVDDGISDSLDDLLGGLTASEPVAAETPAEEPAEEPKPKKTAPKKATPPAAEDPAVPDLDDLLSQL